MHWLWGKIQYEKLLTLLFLKFSESSYNYSPEFYWRLRFLTAIWPRVCITPKGARWGGCGWVSTCVLLEQLCGIWTLAIRSAFAVMLAHPRLEMPEAPQVARPSYSTFAGQLQKATRYWLPTSEFPQTAPYKIDPERPEIVSINNTFFLYLVTGGYTPCAPHKSDLSSQNRF